jgi:hypothetical protein
MIIVFGLAVIKTLEPLSRKENYDIKRVITAIFMVWAFCHLTISYASITIVL